MKHGFLLAAAFCAALASPLAAQHLSLTPAQRNEVNKRIEERRKTFYQRIPALFITLDATRVPDEEEALAFLISALPIGDLADKDPQFLLAQARTALEARSAFPWGLRVPDDLFLHFVLPPRINNEALDSARLFFMPEFRTRLKGLSMHDAALEINRWCHEHVTYRPTDARTASPLAVILAGYGRCGEESTLLTAALRAACIPARQCYTPRWAHTDDNHAWVEVWIDGEWHYVGACEPEPELDLGWFARPVTRTMLVATTAAGDYMGPEPVLSGTGWSTRINLLANYAPVQTLAVRVVDEQGAPLNGASVEFRLYNYAEFYPLTVARTNSDGLATFMTGLGDLFVWAHDGTRTGFSTVSVARTDTLQIVVSEAGAGDGPFDYDLTPPVERAPRLEWKGDRTEHERRIRHADSLRAAYAATFIDSTSSVRFAMMLELSADSVREFLTTAGGNWRAIKSYIERGSDIDREHCLQMLSTIDEKDLRDAPAATLIANLIDASSTRTMVPRVSDRMFLDGLLSPRIGLEPLAPWRAWLLKSFSPSWAGQARKDPATIVAWVRDSIAIDSVQNWARVPLTPRGVMTLRTADPLSRDIFFVALCRTVGVPARLDAATNAPEFFVNGAWTRPRFTTDLLPVRATGALTLLPPSKPGAVTPEYGAHFTVSRVVDGTLRLLDYENSSALSKLPASITVDAGRYAVTTGVRQSDGSVRASLRFVTVDAGRETKVEVVLRDAPLSARSLGIIDADAAVIERTDTAAAPLRASMRARGVVLVWLRANHEPSRHVTGDFEKLRARFEEDGTPVLVFDRSGRTPAELAEAYASVFPSTARFAKSDDALFAGAAKIAGGDGEPVILVVRPDGSVSHATSGYSIGAGEQILTALAR